MFSQPTAGAPTAYQNNTPSQKLDVNQWFASVVNKCEENKKSIESVLPAGHSADRFLTTARLYVRNRDYLWGMHPGKLLEVFIQAAQQGLDFGITNEVHIVPFKGTPALIRGYKGDLKMARRSPNLKFIDAEAVYDGDTFEVDIGENRLIHKRPPLGKSRGHVIGFYARAIDREQNQYIYVMDNEEAWLHAKRFTRATKSGPFAGVVDVGPKAENWIPYGLKTCIHLLCGRKLDLFSEMQMNTEDEGRILREEDAPIAFNLGPIDVTPPVLPEPEPKQETVKEAVAAGVADLDAGKTVPVAGVAEQVKAEGRTQLIASDPDPAEDNGGDGWNPTAEELAEIKANEAAEAAKHG